MPVESSVPTHTPAVDADLLPLHVRDRAHVITFVRVYDGYRYYTQADLNKARKILRSVYPDADAEFIRAGTRGFINVAARSFKRGTDLLYIEDIEGVTFDPPICFVHRDSRIMTLSPEGAAPFLDGDKAHELFPDDVGDDEQRSTVRNLQTFSDLPLFEAALNNVE